MYDSIYRSLVTNKRIDILSLHGGHYGIMWGTFNVKSLSFGGIHGSLPYKNEFNERAKK